MNGSALPCKARCSAAIGYFLTAMTGAFQSLLFQSGGQHFPKCGGRTFGHHILTLSLSQALRLWGRRKSERYAKSAFSIPADPTISEPGTG